MCYCYCGICTYLVKQDGFICFHIVEERGSVFDTVLTDRGGVDGGHERVVLRGNSVNQQQAVQEGCNYMN